MQVFIKDKSAMLHADIQLCEVAIARATLENVTDLVHRVDLHLRLLLRP